MIIHSIGKACACVTCVLNDSGVMSKKMDCCNTQAAAAAAAAAALPQCQVGPTPPDKGGDLKVDYGSVECHKSTFF